jgi:hypothetical protein
MKSRTSNLRAKIVCLLLSLAALWAFAAFVTVRDGLTLLWIRTLDQRVGRPTDALIQRLQEGLTFSPPNSEVRVGGVALGTAYLLEIEDDGLGMSDADLAQANEQLLNPPEFRSTGNARLGLFIVARLALRHGMKVRLRRSAHAGTTARVLVPASLMTRNGNVPDPAVHDDWEPARGRVLASAAGATRTPVLTRTPAGLPVRERRSPTVPPNGKQDNDSPVDVDRARRLTEAYQRGTRRGQAEAQQLSAFLMAQQEGDGDAHEDNGHC